MTDMRRRRPLAALGSVFAALTLAACGGGDAEATAAAGDTAAVSRRVINVEVETARPVAFVQYVRVSGVAEADRDVTLSAEEGGVIRALYAAKGQALAQGQPIAKIDDDVLRAQLRQAEAQAKLAAETYERQRRLWQDEKIGSEISFLQAKYAAEQAAANAEVLAARLARTVVRAPIAGVLDDRLVEVGSMVAPGSAVARIVDPDPIKVTAGVPERYAGLLARGAQATVRFETLGQVERRGRVSFVGTALDADNRTVPIEIAVANPGGGVRPGLAADVAVALQEVEGALTVPQEAVIRAAGGYIVYVARDEDGHTVAESRSVETGAAERGRVIVLSGLEPGDRVIVVGQQRVANGDALNIVVDRTGGDE